MQLSQLKEEHCVLLGFAFFFATVAIITITAIVSTQWRKARQLELEFAFKQDLVERGLSIAQIDQLISLGRTVKPAVAIEAPPKPLAAAAWVNERPADMEATARLRRSVADRTFAGICGGLARYFAVDSTFVRIAYVLATLLTGFFPMVILYVLLTFIIKAEPAPRFAT